MRLLLGLGALLMSSQLFAYGVGVSTYPLVLKKKMLSAEAVGIVKGGSGVGIQGRYIQEINKGLNLNAGLGASGGDRSYRAFAGVDYEIVPDYQNQPRIAINTSIIRANEYENDRNIVSFMPTFSKGVGIKGVEAYPYIAFPMELDLNADTQTYEGRYAMNFGVSGNLPFEGYRKLIGTVETRINFNDSFSAVFMGVSYPL